MLDFLDTSAPLRCHQRVCYNSVVTDAGSLTLSMNDIFRTQLSQSYSESAFFTQTTQRRRDPQVLRLNFSYRFGKFDASLFKRKNTKADQGSGMTDMMNQ